MPRQPRPDYTHTYHHVVVRGVDGLPIFDSNEKKLAYVDLMKDARKTHDLSVYAPVSYTHLTLPTTPYV